MIVALSNHKIDFSIHFLSVKHGCTRNNDERFGASKQQQNTSQTLQKHDINLLRVIKTSETIGFVRSTKGHFYQGFVCYSHPNNNGTFVDEVLHKKLKVSHLIGVVWAV